MHRLLVRVASVLKGLSLFFRRSALDRLPVYAILVFMITLTPACVGNLILTKSSIKGLKRLAYYIAVGRICQLKQKVPTSTLSSTREWTIVQWSGRITLLALLTVFVCSKNDLFESPLVFVVANALVILTIFVASWVCRHLPFVTRSSLDFLFLNVLTGLHQLILAPAFASLRHWIITRRLA